MDWTSEGVNADAVLAALCNDPDIEPDGAGGVVLKRYRPAKAKESAPMSKNSDDENLPAQVEAILKGLTPTQQGVMSQFLGRVMQEQERLAKGRTDREDWDELERYLIAYMQELLAQQTGLSSPPDLDADLRRPKPARGQPAGLTHPDQSPSPAIRALAKRLLKSAMEQRFASQEFGARLMQNEIDKRGGGSPLRKADAHTTVVEIDGSDIETDPVASAQAERDRVARQRGGR